MTRTEATAEIFWTAFKALSKNEQDAVIARMAQDRAFRRDLMDIAIAADRIGDPSRPLAEVLQASRGF